MSAKISVIIATLNSESYLEEAIRSVLNNNANADIEIIIIDGGSVDSTIDIIQKYEANIAYWETGKDSGIADAFNRGVSKSSGDIIAILNSDDYWCEDTIVAVNEGITRNPQADIYYGKIRYINIANNYEYTLQPDITKMHIRMNIFHPAIFVRKACYQSIGLYNTDYKYAMDSEWCHRAIENNCKFEYLDKTLANMRLEGASDIHYVDALREYKKSVIDHHLTSKFTATAYYLLLLLRKKLAKLSGISWILKYRYRLFYSE